MVYLPSMPCICYELEISQEKHFAAVLRPVNPVKTFNSENLGYTVCACKRCVPNNAKIRYTVEPYAPDIPEMWPSTILRFVHVQVQDASLNTYIKSQSLQGRNLTIL